MATWSPNSSTRMVVAPIRNGFGGGERGVETLAISWGEHCSLAVTACGDIHGDTARPPPSLLLNGQGSPHTPCLSTPQHASLCVSPHPAFLLVPEGEVGAEMPLSRLHLLGEAGSSPPPGNQGAWAASQHALPRSVWKLPLGQSQELRTDWQVVQGRRSCRQSWKIPAVPWPQEAGCPEAPPPMLHPVWPAPQRPPRPGPREHGQPWGKAAWLMEKQRFQDTVTLAKSRGLARASREASPAVSMVSQPQGRK